MYGYANCLERRVWICQLAAHYNGYVLAYRQVATNVGAMVN